jgi:hypothetical protein
MTLSGQASRRKVECDVVCAAALAYAIDTACGVVLNPNLRDLPSGGGTAVPPDGHRDRKDRARALGRGIQRIGADLLDLPHTLVSEALEPA